MAIKVAAVVNYHKKEVSLMKISGNSETIWGGSHSPWGGVSVDKRTDNIYVVAEHNNRVEVFDKEGHFLYMFGDRDGTGKLNRPRCISISKEIVVVTQNNEINFFDLNGNFITRKGDFGNIRRYSFCGISICEGTGDIYICNFTNGKVQILMNDFPFYKQFGRGRIKAPYDIELTMDTIFIISNYPPFLFTFNYDLIEVENILQGSIRKYLPLSCGICLDGFGNLIVSSNWISTVVIFDRQGTLLHEITEDISSPMGVTIDSEGRIIVVCY